MALQSLFYPSAIAVIGASRSFQTVGNDIVKNLVLQGYEGEIFPINPKASSLYGKKVYPSLSALPRSVDLVVIAVPAAAVPQAMKEAGEHGVKAAIIISAGFKEVGNAAAEEEIAAICKKHDIELIGPNCLGVINPQIRMNASFAGIMPAFGNVAFVSQSGALCSCILDYAAEFNLGFSKFMSIGNKALIDEVALLEYFAQDEATKVIAMYVEQLSDAPRFISAAKQVTQGKNPKPIIILKSGRTEAGAAAIASHTGSLSGGDAAYEALFAQSGVIRAHTIRELVEFIDIFSHNSFSPAKQITIVTNAGGPGVITADEVISSGLSLATISEATQTSLQSFLPAAASTKNPVDILGDAKADRYRQTLSVLAQDPNAQAVLVLLTPQTMTEAEETAKAIVEFSYSCNKPLVASFMGRETTDHAVRVMERSSVSTTTFPELAVRGLAALDRFVTWSTSPDDVAFPTAPRESKDHRNPISAPPGQQHLPEAESYAIFDAYGLPTLKRQEILSAPQATEATTFFNSPVALKIISKDILHKSDVGGVRLGVQPQDIPEAYASLLETVHRNVPTAELSGVLAVEMAPKDGIECIVGMNTVAGLGKMLMVGLGGIYVEVFKDVQFGYAPLTQTHAQRMVEQLQSLPLLRGTRGQAGYDIDALIAALGVISQLVIDHPEITEIDINPLLVLPKGQGVRALDARIML